MPNVVGKPYADAEGAIKRAVKADAVVVQRADSLTAAADTVTSPAGTVITQSLAPDTKLKGTKDAPDTVRLVVQKDFAVVPAGLVHQTAVDAAGKLGLAGLATKVGWQAGDAALKDKVVATAPPEGALAVRGDTVTITVGYVCTPQTCGVIYQPPRAQVDAILRAGVVRDHRRRPPGGG